MWSCGKLSENDRETSALNLHGASVSQGKGGGGRVERQHGRRGS